MTCLTLHSKQLVKLGFKLWLRPESLLCSMRVCAQDSDQCWVSTSFFTSFYLFPTFYFV